MSAELTRLAEQLGARLAARGWVLCTAESCTGGYIAKVVTDVAGSSAWFDRGFVTYSNRAKEEMLGVPAATLAAAGAVSEATVLAMARGALRASAADWAVAVSGVAGPGGATTVNPVGSVWLAWAGPGGRLRAEHRRFPGGREEVRSRSVAAALGGLIALLADA